MWVLPSCTWTQEMWEKSFEFREMGPSLQREIRKKLPQLSSDGTTFRHLSLTTPVPELPKGPAPTEQQAGKPEHRRGRAGPAVPIDFLTPPRLDQPSNHR